MNGDKIYILGIESSCDDTAASILCDGKVLSNVIANRSIHKAYGGVVPELASRAHQQNIVPVVDQALKQAGISKNELSVKLLLQEGQVLWVSLFGRYFICKILGLWVKYSFGRSQSHAGAYFSSFYR